MRRLLTWLLVTLGVAALVRKLWRRTSKAGTPTLEPETFSSRDHAEALRRTLAESRTDEAADGAPEGTVEERRAEVHAEGRTALDAMHTSDDG